jgi:hypothetical protein
MLFVCIIYTLGLFVCCLTSCFSSAAAMIATATSIGLRHVTKDGSFAQGVQDGYLLRSDTYVYHITAWGALFWFDRFILID